MLVEGGPDYLAALHFILRSKRHDILPVAMLGSGAGNNEIHVEAMRLLTGKRVRVYPHNDRNNAGAKAAQSWGDQLHKIGCQVDFFSFRQVRIADGSTIKDLNDLARLTIQNHPQNSNLLP
jgi:hypothetical protein